MTDRLDKFLETGITSGRYSNASEVVREALRLLEDSKLEEKAKLRWLRAAAKRGMDQIDRGQCIEFRSGDDLDRHIDRIDEARRVENVRKRA